ncbi:MAG: error-prone DNA polymerase [Candidatus Promineifilaceae bacterium]|nr:error-prone DNA polymerase [Candidatus Promineifilaceae bacterium]
MTHPPAPTYVELHCHSCFSLLDGASTPEALAAQAAAAGMPALALTDHDAVYSAPRFIRAAREHGLRPILGAELTLSGGHHLTLLVKNQAGWHNLCYLISRARHIMPKGEAKLAPEELLGCTNGLIALSGCRRGEIATALRRDDRQGALAAARRYRDLFGSDNFWIELQRHLVPGEAQLANRLVALATYLQLGYVATNNVHYARPAGHRLQDILVCIRHLTTLDAIPPGVGPRRFNSEYYLKTAAQMAALFPDHPQALANSVRLAERCQFELDYGLQDLPHFPTPHGMSSGAYLRRLCEEGLSQRYQGADQKPARRQLIHELNIIEQAGLANYFLIVWDIVRQARSQGIRCQGRGSAANSLVAYLLHISPIDPLVHDLVFERFLSAERQVVPDIDIDFDAQRREEVIQYIYQTYGAEHTAMACTFVTFRARSALRDIGKALNLPPETLAAAARALENEAHTPAPGDAQRDTLLSLLELCQQIEGFPRHLGIHSGGMIITGPPLMGRVPTEPATMPDRVVVQWDKEGLEDAGLVKIDILGLRMLSAVTEAADLVAEQTGSDPELDALTFDDPAVFEMIGQADTVGVFQVESRAQAQMLPRLKPRSFNDLVVAISLIRPGPIQGNMVHPYLRRRLNLEPITYAHPLLEPALSETLGVILFQEQVLKVARDLAGFTAGQGEQLRRALGSKRATTAIEALQADFLAGARARGVPQEVAAAVFDQLRAFGGYSFAKSHAAAFTVLVYQSAWLKRYHLAPFYTALLNNQPMGFWTPAVLVNEARRRDLTVLPVDVTASQAVCTVTGESSIRLGFNYVKGLRQEHVQRILNERSDPFISLADFYRRVRPGRQAAENLIRSGAFDGWGVPRRQLLWELGTLHPQEGELALEFQTETAELPPLTPTEAMLGEQEVLGLSTGEHIMAFYRSRLAERGILGSAGLERAGNGQRVQVAGLVVVHQSPPTAKGHHFITLEDEDGLMNIIIRPRVFDRYRRVLREHRLLLFGGVVQRAGEVISLLARQVAPLQQ